MLNTIHESCEYIPLCSGYILQLRPYGGKYLSREDMEMLEAGTKAPEFTFLDKDGNTVSLSDFAGKKVVLYFYPKDNTPGCTRQACAFAGAYEDFNKINAAVIGVSKDSVASHQKFAEKHGLPFILLVL